MAGASVFGIGALCYYGLGMSNEVGTSITDRSMMWPQYVRGRIADTYKYFGGSIVFTAAAAMASFRSPAIMNMMMKNSWVCMVFIFGILLEFGYLLCGIYFRWLSEDLLQL